VAGPATTGNVYVFNNMQGSPLPVPVMGSLDPQDQVEVWLQLSMDPGMAGPHHFLLKVYLAEESGTEYPPLEFHVRGTFG